jgi:hypothetical protein
MCALPLASNVSWPRGRCHLAPARACHRGQGEDVCPRPECVPARVCRRDQVSPCPRPQSCCLPGGPHAFLSLADFGAGKWFGGFVHTSASGPPSRRVPTPRRRRGPAESLETTLIPTNPKMRPFAKQWAAHKEGADACLAREGCGIPCSRPRRRTVKTEKNQTHASHQEKKNPFPTPRLMISHLARSKHQRGL